MAMTLKAIRVNKGLTLDEASKLIGVSKDTLYNYERALTFPDIPTLKNIEEAYETKYDDINFLL